MPKEPTTTNNSPRSTPKPATSQKRGTRNPKPGTEAPLAKAATEILSTSALPRVTVITLARELRVWKHTVFRAMRILGITHQLKADPDYGNCVVASITPAEADAVTQHLSSPRKPRAGLSGPSANSAAPGYFDEVGFFYILQLEPTLDPLRFKVGFTTNLDQRLRDFHTSSPFSDYLKHWPARRIWEQTAIHSITRDAERVRSEVFRVPTADSLQTVIARGETFFNLAMPSLLHELAQQAVQTRRTYNRRYRTPDGPNGPIPPSDPDPDPAHLA